MADQGARLDHVGLSVADLDGSASWFCDVFGLVPELALRVEPLDLSRTAAPAPALTRARPGRPDLAIAQVRRLAAGWVAFDEVSARSSKLREACEMACLADVGILPCGFPITQLTARLG
jgi:hypothetical protein